MTDTTMAAPPPSLRVGEVLNRAFALLSGDLVKFLALAAIALSPLILLALLGLAAAHVTTAGSASVGMLAGFGGVGILLFVLWMVLSVLGQAAALYGAVQKMRSQDFSVGESLARGWARFFPILGMVLLQTLGIVFASIFFVIPGLMFLTTWYVALPACVIERLGPAASLGRSNDLTKGNRWRVFGIIAAVYIANAIVQNVIKYGLPAIIGSIVSTIAILLWMTIFQAFNAIVVAVVYHDLRVAREGIDIDRIAAVFD
ncbi:MAG TPA: hypothetical protein VEI03_13760 [Stellaceae bacterium]|nr:hypothetical protein [Stellaceae bacterium]